MKSPTGTPSRGGDDQARGDAGEERRATGEDLDQEQRWLESLERTTMRLLSTVDEPELLQRMTDAAVELVGAEVGAFYAGADPERAIELATLSGVPRKAFARLDGPEEKVTGSLRSRQILRDPDLANRPEVEGAVALDDGTLAVRSALAVPVSGRDGVLLGGLFLGHSRPRRFGPKAERAVSGFAAQAAMCIEHSRMYAAAVEAAEERRRLLEAEREARLELERAALVKDEFVATLSHELRTPLNAILGWAEMLLHSEKALAAEPRGDGREAIDRPTEPDADARRAASLRRGLETIARNARSQAKLIDDLLDMSRLLSGRVRLELGPVDLGGVIESAVASLRAAAQAKSIRLRVDLDPAASPLRADAERLQQVVWNLLSNAVKFTPEHGEVEIRARHEGAHAVIEVSDSGVGIEPEFLPLIFDRFRQGDSTLTRRFRGVGVGLSIVRQLVELHGGSIEADSEGPGCGATFAVRLPLEHPGAGDSAVPARQSSVADIDTPGEPPALAGLRVLVVDDEEDVRDLADAILREAGAEVMTAASPDPALELLAAARPDVLVSDIGMPEKDGYRFLEEVRQRPRQLGGSTPAVALTAFARPEDRYRAAKAGYQAHLTKPVEPAELVRAVAQAAGRGKDGNGNGNGNGHARRVARPDEERAGSSRDRIRGRSARSAGRPSAAGSRSLPR